MNETYKIDSNQYPSWVAPIRHIARFLAPTWIFGYLLTFGLNPILLGESFTTFTSHEIVLYVISALVMISLALSFKWELLGGILGIIFNVSWYIIDARLWDSSPFMYLLPITSVLFFVCGIANINTSKRLTVIKESNVTKE